MASKIVVRHSRIEINNYDIGDCPKLERTFSIWDPVTHKLYTKGIEYNSEKKILYLPRGIDIPYLEFLFNCTAEVDKICDKYVNTNPIPIKYLTRNEVQLQTLKFLLGEDEYKYTITKSQLSVNLSTGVGKTFVTVASICFTGSRAVIITSSIDWLNQWKQRIMEYTPITEDQIFMITGSSSIDKILCRNPENYQIFLASHSTVKSYGDKNGWDKVDDLFRYLKCGLKVFDEAHLYFDNICQIDFHSNFHRTLYLTATPNRSNNEEDKIYQLYFKNIPSIDLFDENNDPHTDYIAFHFNSHPTPYDVKMCRNAYGLNRSKYTNYVVSRPSFNMLLIVLIELALGINGKCLIYVGTNEAIKEVKDNILFYFPFLKNNVGTYTSLVKENKNDELYKKFIISTTKSAGAASDIYGLGITINLAEPFKSSVLARQTLGRTRANNTLYIDVVDEGFFYTKKYYKDKMPTFSVYAKSCRDVYLSDAELETRSEAIINKYNTMKVMATRVYNK